MSLDSYLNGNDERFREAVIECMPLVDKAVTSFLSRAPGYSGYEDDLISEGHLALLTLLPRVRSKSQTRKNFEPKLHIENEIQEVIGEHLRKETNLGMSLSTWNRLKKTGDLVPQSTTNHGSIDASINEVPVQELRETIYDCCESAEERLIIDMREKGFSYREVADELGMSTGQVHKYLEGIYSRLQKELQS